MMSEDRSDADVYSESIRIESKVIYADLRVNARGQYLKLSETGSRRPRSTVLLPASAVSWLYSLLEFYIRECAAGRQPGNKQLAVETKVFAFSVGGNERGRFLRVSEAGVSSSGRHTLIIPSGEELSGWAVLRDCIRRVAAFVDPEPAPQAPPPPPPPPPRDPGALTGPSTAPQQQQQQRDTERASAAAAGPSAPRPVPRPQLGEDPTGPEAAPQLRFQPAPRLVDVSRSSTVGPGHAPPSLSTSPQGTPVLTCQGRRVFFDLGATPRGQFMRITQVAQQDRSSIVIPAVAVPKFREAVDTCAMLLDQQQAQQPPPPPPPPPQQQQQQREGPWRQQPPLPPQPPQGEQEQW